MKRHFIIWISLAALLLISVPAAAELEKRLPADTLMYVEWSGRNLTFDGSMCGQAINDPDTQKLIQLFQTFMQKKMIQGGPPEMAQIAKTITEIPPLVLQHRTAVAITKCSLARPKISFAVLVDFGKDKAVFQKKLDAILAVVPKNSKPPKKELGETKYRQLMVSNAEMSYGFIGKSSLFFFSYGTGQAKTIIQATAAKSLAGNKKFVGCMKEVGGENQQVAYYVDVAALKKRLQPAAPADTEAPKAANALDTVVSAATMLKILGVSKISALAGTVRIVDKGMYSKTRLFTPVPHQGLLMPFAGKPLTDADLAAVPADADFVLAGNVSPKAFFAELRRVVGQINPRSGKMITGVLAGMDKTLGMSIEKDLLAALGDTWVLSSATSQGGTLTGTILTLELADEEKAAAALAKIEKFIELQAGRNASLEIFKSGKTDIRYLRFTGGRPGAGMFVLPAWAIHKKRLYIALWPQVIASALENKTAPLTTAAAFKKTRAHVSANASGLFYLNTPEVLKKVYPLYLVGGTGLSNAAGQALAREFGGNIGLDKISFPLPDSLQGLIKYAMPDISSVSSDAKGITFEGYGSTPLVGVVPIAVTAIAAFYHLADSGVIAPESEIDQDEQVMATNNLKIMMNARELYNFKENKNPRSFDDFVKKGYLDEIPKGYKYIYYAKPAKGALLFCANPKAFKNKGTYVALIGGGVRWVDMATLRKLLKKSLAAGGKITPAAKKPAGKSSAPAKTKAAKKAASQNRARAQAKKKASLCNLNGIAKACVMYSMEHDKMPPNFDAMVEEKLVGSSTFKSPVSENPAPHWDPKSKTLMGVTDYVYIYYHYKRGVDDGPVNLLLLAYEIPSNYGNKGTSVLWGDFTVSWVKMATFREQLKKSLDAGGKIIPPSPGVLRQPRKNAGVSAEQRLTSMSNLKFLTITRELYNSQENKPLRNIEDFVKPGYVDKIPKGYKYIYYAKPAKDVLLFYADPADFKNKGTYVALVGGDSSGGWVDMAMFRELLKKSLIAGGKITPVDKKPAGKSSAKAKTKAAPK
ncbi:MAG: DUF3352 domain-containing protein [Phycisphaerae bacterium]|nr:DUF3352 domain-containing protein [Phycisphaerae bacterium]